MIGLINFVVQEKREWRFLIIVIAAVLFLNGCVNTSEQSRQKNIISEVEFSKKYISTSGFRQQMIDTTRHSFGSGHGTQIEYHAANGKSFLWYPGNNVILPALWKVEDGSERVIVHVQTANGIDIRKAIVPVICYFYGGNTYNPVTSQRGGNWNCRSIRNIQLLSVELRKGDVFGLSKSPVPPFVLRRNNTSIEELLARCKNC